MKNKCDISQLKLNFPQKSFEPWTSEGEALLAKHGCDVIALPSKNGTEHLIGKKVNQFVFVANAILQPMTDYDTDETANQLRVLRREKIIVTGQNGSGAVISSDDSDKMIKSLKKVVNDD